MTFTQEPCSIEKIMRPGVEGRLILGDGTRPPEEYKGKVQCVYIDPPFNTGRTFGLRACVGAAEYEKGIGSLTLDAYEDKYPDRESYHQLLEKLIIAARDLLTDSGSFFLHLDQREAPYGRLIADRVFGENNFVNEIVWAYQSGGRSMKRFSAKHDTSLFYRRSRAHFFDITGAPVPRSTHRHNHMKRQVDANGRSYRTIRSGGKTYTYYDDDPVYPGDVWTDVSHLQQKDPQRTGYDTQKPVSLLRRIFACTTRPGDLTADLCCGSGTAAVAALGLERNFLAMDTSPLAVAVSRKRLTEAALTTQWKCGVPGAGITAEIIPGIGFHEIILTGYDPGPGPLKPGLDSVDAWAVGFIRDGMFQTHDLFCRTRPAPELNTSLLLPQLRGSVGILTVDAMGRPAVWRLNEEI